MNRDQTVVSAPAAPAAPPPTLAAAVDQVRRSVERSGTSFFLGMRVLPRLRREAMYAVYAFCREVDDIADEPGAVADKLAALDDWRAEIDRLYAGTPGRPVALALAGPVVRYDLPAAEFLAMIDGMAMDAREAIVAPDLQHLDLYCRRVAGSVGLLSIRVFGATEPAAGDFALALARGLQLTNILRDLAEDAERGRLYLPAEALEAAGIATRDPLAVIDHAHLPVACRQVAEMAEAAFGEADRALASCRRRRLVPALLMMGVYDETLRRLKAADWQHPHRRLRLGRWAKLVAAVGRGVFRPSVRP